MKSEMAAVEKAMSRVLRVLRCAKKYQVVTNRYYGYTDSAVLVQTIHKAIDSAMAEAKRECEVLDE